MKNELHVGFAYTLEVVRNGEVIERETVKNLMPIEGLNHMESVLLLGAAQVTTWHVGIYENNYTPQSTDVASTFAGGAVAGEITTYNEATRVPLVPSTPAGGVSDNIANKAEFTLNAAKTAQGGFVSSAPTKGALTGVLLSAVKFTTPKVLGVGDILRVTAGFSASST